jgi:hypothetical protein
MGADDRNVGFDAAVCFEVEDLGASTLGKQEGRQEGDRAEEEVKGFGLPSAGGDSDREERGEDRDWQRDERVKGA